jgi:hypothetical protein
LVGDRLGFDHPWVDVLALPVALIASLLVGSTTLGSLLLYPFRIQFHELGHALVAWLSGRAALPLPFGFTFWREERSLFTGCCVCFLVGLLLVHAVREKRPFGVLIAALLSAAFVVLAMVLSVDRSRELILLGGLAGELVLPSLSMVAFYFPLPDRLRWDFFRFVLLVPASGCWLASLRMWFGVWRGTRTLPMGSILGTDGSGDLDRLMAEYGHDTRSISTGYGELALWTVALVLAVYTAFALRAWWRLWPTRAFVHRTARVSGLLALRASRRARR